MKHPSPLERLATEPQRFGFDAAVRVLLHAAQQTDPALVVRFRSPPGLAYPAADVLGIQSGDEAASPRMTVTVMGLIGPSGVLPRTYTETVGVTLRTRSRGLHDFMDMLSHRMVALFARAGSKYRPHRAAEISQLAGAHRAQMTTALLSLTGYGTAHTAERLLAGTEPLLHYAGLMAARPRSADRLQALVSDWLGRPVEVRQFVGAWLKLPPDQRTRLAVRGLPGAFDRLGRDAAIGVRAWDVQAGIVLRIGPLDHRRFAALLPDQPLLARLVSLVRAYCGVETGFAINPILSRDAVPPLQLRADADPAPRLGWNSWLTAPPGTRRRNADEAVFDADIVEAQTPAAGIGQPPDPGH